MERFVMSTAEQRHGPNGLSGNQSNSVRGVPSTAMEPGSTKPSVMVLLVLAMLTSWQTALADSYFLPDAQWQGPALGQAVSGTDSPLLPEHIFVDGRGLPVGQGSAAEGGVLYAQRCASCHGSHAQGGRSVELLGDRASLNTAYPDKGIAVRWPAAPALFDYVYRAMPPEEPASLSANQVYAVLAYLLVLNDLLGEDQLLNAETLSLIDMPNRDGFRTIGR